MPGGQRRLANVRKLMRLAREHEAAHGPGLRAFLDLVARRVRGGSASESGDARESEAPVEGEALDAVRLMTIHRAKGLEFDVVCVADLGRGPRWRAELMRVGRDGRFGLRLAEPGTGRRESALDYKALGEERVATESREERRLFYVAMTRARERLILSGAAKLDAWPALENGGGGGPIAWIGPAVEPLDGVAVTFVRPEDVPAVPPAPAPAVPPEPAATPAPAAVTSRATGRHPATGRHSATGERAELLLARRVRALRIPVLRRTRSTAAAAPGARRRRCRPYMQRARSARSIAARSSTRCSSGSTFAGRYARPRR